MKNFRKALLSTGLSFVFGWVTNTLSGSYAIPTAIAWTLAGICFIAYIVNMVQLRERIQAKATSFKVPAGEKASSVHKSKKGLIISVSPPRTDIDWAADIPNTSNLYPLLTAIKAHGGSLKHIWLLGTADTEEGKGSVSIFDDLTAYIQRNLVSLGLEKRVQIHPLEAIPMKFDSQVTECARRAVDEVFDNAANYGLKQRDIIADCTGGTKSMTLGVILACLEEDRDIQLIGSEYKPDGWPNGATASPMIFEYTTSRAEYNK